MPEGGPELVARLFQETPRAGHGGQGWVSGAARHAASGSELRWHWRVAARHIEECRYEVRGCPHLVAGAALAAELLEGQTADAPRLEPRHLLARLGAPLDKLGKFLLLQDAAEAAAIQFRGQQP
jgi:NifU-like protein involved in Fe-S cluster formation